MRMNETTIHESHYFFPCFWHQMKKSCQNASWCFKLSVKKNWSCQRMTITKNVIHANGRLNFDDDLRSGGLIYYVSQWISIHTELADRDCYVLEKEQFELLDTSSSSKHSFRSIVEFAGEWAQCMFPDQNCHTKVLCWWDDNAGLGARNNGERAWPSFLVWSL